MGEMIERVGEAIARQMAEDDNDNASLGRAAIAAMREPTEEMLEAANDADRGMLPWAYQWRAMINKALEA